MALKITSPLAGHDGNGTFGPVTLKFVDGVAEAVTLSDGLRNYLERRGYQIEDEEDLIGDTAGTDPDQGTQTVVPEELPTAEWTHTRLDEFAAAKGISLSGTNTKADKASKLLAALDKPPVSEKPAEAVSEATGTAQEAN